jgi:hypothetical protein
MSRPKLTFALAASTLLAALAFMPGPARALSTTTLTSSDAARALAEQSVVPAAPSPSRPMVRRTPATTDQARDGAAPAAASPAESWAEAPAMPTSTDEARGLH